MNSTPDLKMMQTYLKAFGLGVVAGMRALAAPALLSHKLVRTVPIKQPTEPIHYLAQPPAEMALKVLAVVELLGDKIPNGPDRTIPLQFGVRIASGATCGAFLGRVEGTPVAVGALAGGVGAVVGTLAFFHLRQWLDDESDLPAPLVALAEDALAIGLGWQLVNSIKPGGILPARIPI